MQDFITSLYQVTGIDRDLDVYKEIASKCYSVGYDEVDVYLRNNIKSTLLHAILQDEWRDLAKDKEGAWIRIVNQYPYVMKLVGKGFLLGY